MKSLMVLWKHLADELAGWCHVSTDLDYKKLEVRVKHEGESFLQLTLPKFGKDFERSLEQGYVDRCLFHGFAWKGGLPLFLSGFLGRVFDAESGVLLDEPCEDSILAVRQLTLMFAKMLQPVREDRERAAFDGYIDVEQEVEGSAEVFLSSPELISEFERIGALLWADALTEVDRKVHDGELMPKHGPGSTAERLLGNKKYNQLEWTSRLEGVFPFLENVLPSARYYRALDRVTFLEPDAERPVRVVSVPKTLARPRIIALEPTCMQFMQQAISEALVQELERRYSGVNTRQNLCYGFLGFSSQDPNRDMARIGSRDKTLATLDMSEASDRVANQHVLSLLRRWPLLSEAVQATRSRKADVPGAGVIPLTKFASMGSALCFPMEAMVFTTVIFLGLQMQHSTRFTRKDIESYRGKVRVYGDDIIIPADSVQSVIGALESFGFKVNTNKSFWNGKFRESCGGDYYNGRWVTPIRLRRPLPSSRTQALETASLVSFRNQLYLAGYWQTCRWLDGWIRDLLGFYPVVAPHIGIQSHIEVTSAKSSLLGRVSFLPPKGEREHRNLHHPLVKGWTVSAKIPSDPLDGLGALVKWYLKRGEQPFQDIRHLERAGRPQVVNIKLGWRDPGFIPGHIPAALGPWGADGRLRLPSGGS